MTKTEKRIVSVMKESIGNTPSLSKLKIKTDDGARKNNLKAISYMQRKIKDMYIDEEVIMNAIDGFTTIQVDEEEIFMTLEDDKIHNGSGFKKVDFEYSAYNGDIYHSHKIYFSSNLTLSKHGSNYSWRSSGEKFEVYNYKRIIASRMLWEKIEKYISEEDLESVKNYFVDYLFIKRESFFGSVFEKKINEAILEAFQEELNIDLMNKYVSNNKKEIAGVMDTKKNINKSVMEAMQDNKFINNGFDYVEFDNHTDLNQMELLENEWIEIKKLLPEIKNTDLRFRKLGKHKALGMYSPFHNCIAIDIRNVNSFIHEYGHMLDFKLNDQTISMQDEFKPIMKSYREEIERILPDSSYVKEKINYYTTPTEVFARAYEIYMLDKLSGSSFMKDNEAYKDRDEYKTFTDSNIEAIKVLMNKFVG